MGPGAIKPLPPLLPYPGGRFKLVLLFWRFCGGKVRITPFLGLPAYGTSGLKLKKIKNLLKTECLGAPPPTPPKLGSPWDNST